MLYALHTSEVFPLEGRMNRLRYSGWKKLIDKSQGQELI